jgi:membrane protein
MERKNSGSGRGQRFSLFAPVRLLMEAAKQWFSDNTFEIGAAMAFYALFSISPLIVLTIAVAGLILGKEAAEGGIAEQLGNILGPNIAQTIQNTLSYAYQTGSGTLATIVSIVLLLFGAAGFFSELQRGLKRIWGLTPKRGFGIWGFVRDRFWSFLTVLGLCLLGLLSLMANAAFSIMAELLPKVQISSRLSLWYGLTHLVSFAFVALAIAIVFRLLPDARIAWRSIWIGAAISAALFILGNYLIGLYLHLSDITSAYGASGSLVALMLWIYYSVQILLFGAEITQVYAQSRGLLIASTEHAERLL